MKLRLLAAAIAGLVLTTGAAHAQIGVYVTPNFSRISNSTVDDGVFAFLGSGQTSKWFKGWSFGMYDDFYHNGKLDAGIDARAGFLRGGGATLNSFMLGARVAYHPDSTRLIPFGELIGGVGGSSPAHNPATISKGMYQVSGGVDLPLNHTVDWRAVEVGYGSVTTVSSGAVNGSTTLPPASHVVTISTGFVFHFHTSKRSDIREP